MIKFTASIAATFIALVIILHIDKPNLPQSQKIYYDTEYGVYHIGVKVNDCCMNFILDSGCSDMVISKKILKELFKKKILFKKDLCGHCVAQSASGNCTFNTMYNIKTIVICGKTIHNIKCIVMDSDKSENLLGISVLKKLGKITIDFNNLELLSDNSK